MNQGEQPEPEPKGDGLRGTTEVLQRRNPRNLRSPESRDRTRRASERRERKSIQSRIRRTDDQTARDKDPGNPQCMTFRRLRILRIHKRHTLRR